MSEVAEHVLRNRIRKAAAAAQRAVGNKDEQAYARAVAHYAVADRQLRELEAERNKQAIEELEAKADRWGVLTYGEVNDANVPPEVLTARGWTDSAIHGGFYKQPAARERGPASLAIVRDISERLTDGAATSGSGETLSAETDSQAHE